MFDCYNFDPASILTAANEQDLLTLKIMIGYNAQGLPFNIAIDLPTTAVQF